MESQFERSDNYTTENGYQSRDLRIDNETVYSGSCAFIPKDSDNKYEFVFAADINGLSEFKKHNMDILIENIKNCKESFWKEYIKKAENLNGEELENYWQDTVMDSLEVYIYSDQKDKYDYNKYAHSVCGIEIYGKRFTGWIAWDNPFKYEEEIRRFVKALENENLSEDELARYIKRLLVSADHNETWEIPIL